MVLALITAFGVGGATVIGALSGFLFKKIPHKYNDIIMGFAAGVMLCASMIGLIIPSIDQGRKNGVIITVAGIILGAVCLNAIDRFVPHIHSIIGIDKEKHTGNTVNIDKVLLFVTAIAIHNFPEGLAAGVSFGTGDIGNTLTVAGGIALQNIPEGMVIIPPLLMAGVSRRKTFIIALITGLIEVAGTLIGYLTVSVASFVLPFTLAFAGGTMLYVISDEMIPETHSHGFERSATYSIIIGFSLMLILDYYLQISTRELF